jgi:hypothetical protein
MLLLALADRTRREGTRALGDRRSRDPAAAADLGRRGLPAGRSRTFPPFTGGEI